MRLGSMSDPPSPSGRPEIRAMPVAPCRTVASPETAQPERPYPTLAAQASAHRASLPRGSRPPPLDWAGLGRRSPSLWGADSRHFSLGQTLEHRARVFLSPSLRRVDRGVRHFLPPQPARAGPADPPPPDGAQPMRQAD